VFAEDYKVVIFMKIRKQAFATLASIPDVRLSIASTPQKRSIQKIKPPRCHHMTDARPEDELIVTIFISKGQLASSTSK
jgi:hypothetical protein